MSNRNANIRMQAADLISKIADLLKLCGEYDSLKLLGGVLYEFLGEEYPDVYLSLLRSDGLGLGFDPECSQVHCECDGDDRDESSD